MVKRNFCAKMMVLTTVCCLFLTACHSSLSVEKRKHRKGYYFSISNDKVKTEVRSESAILQKSSVAEKPFSQIDDSVIVDIMAAVVKPKSKVLQDTTAKQKRQCKMKIAKDSASRSIFAASSEVSCAKASVLVLDSIKVNSKKTDPEVRPTLLKKILKVIGQVILAIVIAVGIVILLAYLVNWFIGFGLIGAILVTASFYLSLLAYIFLMRYFIFCFGKSHEERVKFRKQNRALLLFLFLAPVYILSLFALASHVYNLLSMVLLLCALFSLLIALLYRVKIKS